MRANIREHRRPARIFKNPFVEMFTRTSLLITMIHYPLVIAALIYLGVKYTAFSVSMTLLFCVAGLMFWTLFEYIMHRYLFHINSHVHTHGAERFQYVLHGIHHQNPRDEERVFMPPLPGLIIVAVLLGLNYIVMQGAAWFFTAGMTAGYLGYAWIHYNVHLKPPHRFFRKWWQHHALHHYKYPDKAFGVSSPVWDIVFGTMPPDPDKVQEDSHIHLN
ncbi:MAG TPA: sterol desaturase family protein [Bacteroidia bacterium]|nr:sterol desaturase family protein [Bacteroidia bacterium]